MDLILFIRVIELTVWRYNRSSQSPKYKSSTLESLQKVYDFRHCLGGCEVAEKAAVARASTGWRRGLKELSFFAAKGL